MSVYSLSNYIVEISIPVEYQALAGTTLNLGGKNSFVESIEVSISNDIFSIKGNANGNHIFTKNYDRSGEVIININQLSRQSKLLHKITENYFSDNFNDEPFRTINIRNIRTGGIEAEIKNAFIKKHPNKKFSTEADNEEWVFIAEEIKILK